MLNFIKYQLLIIFILTFCLQVKSQEQNTKSLVVISWVKKDTILLRWAPNTGELLLEGLKYGYSIDRIESDNNNFDQNPAKKTFIIPPFKMDNTIKDSTILEISALIESMLKEENLDKSVSDFLYSILVMGAGSNQAIAKKLNLLFVNSTIDSKKKYKYRIQLLDKNGKPKEFISSTINVNSAIESKSPKNQSFVAKQEIKEKKVYLSWEAEKYEKDFSAYWIVRSDDGKSFIPIHKNPYAFFKSEDEPEKTKADYIDTNIIEGRTYYYKINEINHFGEITGSTNKEKVYIKKLLKGWLQIDTVYSKAFKRIIEGQYIKKDPLDLSKLNKIILFRSDSINNGYKKIDEMTPINGKYSFSAKSPLESGEKYYYKTAAISLDNDTIYSFSKYFFTLDQIPPSAPKNLAGNINNSGTVSINWSKNPEDDIMGYRVFRSNSLSEEFIEITTQFNVTLNHYDTLSLNNLTHEIYYYIRAVDNNYNNSTYSETIKLIKPDYIPPVRCIINNYNVLENGVSITWNNSSSNDVYSNSLIRLKESLIDTIYTWEDTTSTFIDTSANNGNLYTYQIITTDLSQNKSSSKKISINYETGIRKGIKNLEGIINREDNAITLNWTIGKEKNYSYYIYRSKNESNYRLVKTITDQDIQSYLDKDLSINNIYQYKISILYKNGIKSQYSNEVTITF